jgi:hypothetical protein
MDYKAISLPEDWLQESDFIKKRTTFNQPHSVMPDQSRKHYLMPKDDGTEESFSYYVWIT